MRTSLVYIFNKLIFDSGEIAAGNTRADIHRTTETTQKNLEVISTILQHSNLPPFTELLEKVNTFNAAVLRSASFLAEKSIYKASEAFDEEMESSMEDVKEIIGGRLSKMLVVSFTDLMINKCQSVDDKYKRCWLLKRIIRGRVPQGLGGFLCASSFRSSSSTSAFRRSTLAASLVSKTLASSLHTDFFDSGSPNYKVAFWSTSRAILAGKRDNLECFPWGIAKLE